jgi:hypothetical protein
VHVREAPIAQVKAKVWFSGADLMRRARRQDLGVTVEKRTFDIDMSRRRV